MFIFVATRRLRFTIFLTYPISAFFILGSCVMHSNINSTKYKGSDINMEIDENTISPGTNKTILGSALPISQLLTTRGMKQGTYFISLINDTDKTYKESRLVKETSDSVWLDITVSNLAKTEKSRYEIIYPKNTLSIKLTEISNSHYRISIKLIQDGVNLSDDSPHNDLFITKSANFEIERGLLHLYSGEIESESGSSARFLIINDPEDTVPVLGSVLYTLFAPAAAVRDLDCDKTLRDKCKDLGLVLKAGPVRHAFTSSESNWLNLRYECTGNCICKK